MSSEPPVKDLDDVIRWVAAHRAATHERHAAQEKRDEQLTTDLKAFTDRCDVMAGRVSCLEKMVVRWSTLAALTGAALGAAGVQLYRHYLLTGAQ